MYIDQHLNLITTKVRLQLSKIQDLKRKSFSITIYIFGHSSQFMYKMAKTLALNGTKPSKLKCVHSLEDGGVSPLVMLKLYSNVYLLSKIKRTILIFPMMEMVN